MSDKYVCIHGHFYQPPRENPWLEAIELQDSAYPYHDWNVRITSECYATNTAAHILNPDRKIIDIVNNYSRISFNFGPTLLCWLELNQPHVYNAILEADQKSMEFFSGHGSAIAQVYNHIIMPLAESRDKETQIIWGIKDFQHRFKRHPEGMWLPETAVDLESLDLLAKHGIKFTILSPRQASKVRRIGETKWCNVEEGKIDPRRAYLCGLPSGRSITLFFYDGFIASDIAFGDLLENGEVMAERILSAFSDDSGAHQIVNVATDGETFGHHHKNGDMALAYCLYRIDEIEGVKPVVYGEYLEMHPPEYEAMIFEQSSWSCVHGVERWCNDCGCNSGMQKGWHQRWRAPLRGAMDWLRDNLCLVYEDHAAGLFSNPWQARNDYIEVILERTDKVVEDFITFHAGRKLTKEEFIKALKLLEMQRHAMLMYTSCGWFFDDISGIETVKVLQYASRALQLAREISSICFEEPFVKLLEKSESNMPDIKNGAEAYQRFVKPSMLDLIRVGAHYAVSSLFTEYTEDTKIYTYSARCLVYDRFEMGRQKAAVGKAFIRSDITGEDAVICFAVIHLGDHNLSGGVKYFTDDGSFQQMCSEIEESFQRGDVAGVLNIINKYFETDIYTLWHLFCDEQREIFQQIFQNTQTEVEGSFRQIYEHHYPVMQAVEGLNLPLPKYFSVVVEFIVNVDILRLLKGEEFSAERLQRLVDETNKWNLVLDKPSLSLAAKDKLTTLMKSLLEMPDDLSLVENIKNLLHSMKSLSLDVNLRDAQNVFFSLGQKQYFLKKDMAASGDEKAVVWVEMFDRLGESLGVRVE